MKFNEKVHAFISAKFYEHLTKKFGDRGLKAFIHATQYYAMQRGRRMAQRAIRDGKELTQATYNYYGEWINSEEIKEAGIANKSEKLEDGKIKITICPWNEQFKEMVALDAGDEYCKHLDSAISRGFNPYIGYEVSQNLNSSDCCIHYINSGNIVDGVEKGKNQKSLKSFEYHCAHSYWAYAEVTSAIFLQEGEVINSKVLEDFKQEYGKEMADILYSYKYANFNICGI